MPHNKLIFIPILFIFVLLITGCRATSPAFKGMELYSWQDQEGDWSFSIMLGTNRLKIISEVKDNALRMHDVKKKFCRMAKGEQILWITSAQDPNAGEQQPLPYPPEGIINEIKGFTETCDVKLILSPRSN